MQDAFEANDREAVVDMVRLPLRVNGPNGSYIVQRRAYLERHFDQIFDTPTRAAIMAQDPDDIFERDTGGMIGDGQVWFNHRCVAVDCAQMGAVAIYVVNHIAESEEAE
ncbi:hypothetical protein [Aurantiacibacter aquimixticola]|uniref:hypothetical protein n=1 Tax=Aurantiacibacter aquimixticola TaxID=1958945 RepID=UPI001058D382|nr:hypothetical protein [Aurantiacibacter aquimixticola]